MRGITSVALNTLCKQTVISMILPLKTSTVASFAERLDFFEIITVQLTCASLKPLFSFLLICTSLVAWASRIVCTLYLLICLVKKKTMLVVLSGGSRGGARGAAPTLF